MAGTRKFPTQERCRNRCHEPGAAVSATPTVSWSLDRAPRSATVPPMMPLLNFTWPSEKNAREAAFQFSARHLHRVETRARHGVAQIFDPWNGGPLHPTARTFRAPAETAISSRSLLLQHSEFSPQILIYNNMRVALGGRRRNRALRRRPFAPWLAGRRASGTA